jgi:hypothetical protein
MGNGGGVEMKLERTALLIMPWIGLALTGFFFMLLFPDFTDIQNWIFSGLRSLLFPIWFLTGGVIGVALSAIWSRWPKRTISVIRRGTLILFGYIGIAIVIALVTGEGDGLSRIGDSGPVKVWALFVWILVSMFPSLLGTIAIINGSKWARGGSVLSYISLATALMIFSQARYAKVSFQDPLISIIFIWVLILYIESLNWKKRYIDHELTSLWLRQALFTVLFLGIGSLVVYIPFVFSEDIMGSYEGTTVLGKAVIGAMILIPLGMFAWIKGFLDSRSRT